MKNLSVNQICNFNQIHIHVAFKIKATSFWIFYFYFTNDRIMMFLSHLLYHNWQTRAVMAF